MHTTLCKSDRHYNVGPIRHWLIKCRQLNDLTSNETVTNRKVPPLKSEQNAKPQNQHAFDHRQHSTHLNAFINADHSHELPCALSDQSLLLVGRPMEKLQSNGYLDVSTSGKIIQRRNKAAQKKEKPRTNNKISCSNHF